MFNRPINAGELKHPIKILEFKSTIDEDGFAIEDWVEVRSARCKVTNPNIIKFEELSNEGIISKKIKYFTFRKKLELNTKIRIKYKNQTYEVDGDVDSNNDELYQTVRGILVT